PPSQNSTSSLGYSTRSSSSLRISAHSVSIQNPTGSKRLNDPNDANAQRISTCPKSLPNGPCKCTFVPSTTRKRNALSFIVVVVTQLLQKIRNGLRRLEWF